MSIDWDPKKYDTFARHQRQNGFKILAENYAKIAAKPYPARALDMGCGTGAITKLLGHFPTYSEIIGVDPDQDMLERAKKINTDPRISFAQGNACDFATFPKDSAGSYDLITAVATMHWWPDAKAGIGNVFRALKPGGFFMGYTWADRKKIEDQMATIINSDGEFLQFSEGLKKTVLRPPAPWSDLDNQEEKEKLIQDYFVRAGFQVELCKFADQKMYRTQDEALLFVEYVLGRYNKGIAHKLDEQLVKNQESEFSMEWNPNVELSSACGRGLSAQPHALDSSIFGFHSIENSDS